MTEKTKTTTKKAAKPKVEPVVEETPVESTFDLEAGSPFDAFLDHQKKALNEAGRALESLIPVEFREHGRQAFKEVVEGYRELFNTALDEVVENIERVKIKKEDEKETTK